MTETLRPLSAFHHNPTARALAFRLLFFAPIIAANLCHIFLPPSSNAATKRAHT